MTTLRVDPAAADLGWLTRLARSLVLDQNEADDLVQESWLIALARPPVSGRITQGWIATVIRNVQRLKLRTRKRERAREARVARPESVLQGEHLLERLEVAEIVLREVKALDPIYREVVLYRYHWGLTPSEIAGQLDVSVATVHTRLRRAHEQLRARFESRFEGDVRLALVPLLLRPMSATGSSAAMLVGGLLLMKKVAVLVAGLVLLLGWLGYRSWVGGPEAPRVQPPVAKAPTTESDETREPLKEDLEKPHAKQPADTVPEESPIVAELCMLQGQVWSGAGSPVAGAVVILGDPQKNRPFQSKEFAFYFHRLPEESPGMRRTTTDSDGFFQFEEVPPGPAWGLLAVHPAEGIAFSAGLPVTLEASPVEVDLHLTGGVVIHGTVTDPKGNPVPEAGITLSTGRDIALALTDESGQYRFYPLPNPGYGAFVNHQDFLWEKTRRFEVPPGQSEYRLDFQLQPGIRLRGRIRDANGGPSRLLETVVPYFGVDDPAKLNRDDLHLRASGEDPRTAGTSWHALGTPEILYEEDAYEVTLRERSTKVLSLLSRERFLGLGKIVTLEAAPDILLEPDALDRLAAGRLLELHVRDAETGEPVPRLEMELYSLLDLSLTIADLKIQLHQKVEEASGVYRVESLPAGDYQITLRSPGYAPAWRRVSLEKERTRHELEISLRPGVATLAGVVTDSAGQAVSGAEVFIYSSDGELTPPSASILTNLDGRFEFTGLPEGDHLVVAEVKDLVPTAEQVNTTGRSREHELVLVLVEGVKVALRPSDRRLRLQFSVRVFDDNGTFLYDDIRRGVYHGGGARVTLARGRDYTVEMFCAGHEVGRQTFRAEEGTMIEVEMVPVKKN